LVNAPGVPSRTGASPISRGGAEDTENGNNTFLCVLCEGRFSILVGAIKRQLSRSAEPRSPATHPLLASRHPATRRCRRGCRRGQRESNIPARASHPRCVRRRQAPLEAAPELARARLIHQCAWHVAAPCSRESPASRLLIRTPAGQPRCHQPSAGSPAQRARNQHLSHRAWLQSQPAPPGRPRGRRALCAPAQGAKWPSPVQYAIAKGRALSGR